MAFFVYCSVTLVNKNIEYSKTDDNARQLESRSRRAFSCLKIAKGGIKAANEKGILREYLFYLVIKKMSIPGYLKKGSYLKDIQSRIKEYNSKEPIFKLPTSLSQISTLINKCNKSGLLRKNNRGIYLNSYDKVLEVLGLSYKKKLYYRLDKNTFFEDLYLKEIEKNLKAQRKAKRMSDPEVKRNRSVKTRLSCIGFAKLLGFNSKSFGQKVRDYFIKRQLLEVVIHKMRKLQCYYPYDQVFKIGNIFFHRPCQEVYLCTISL